MSLSTAQREASDVAVVGSDVIAEADNDRVLTTLDDMSDLAAESLALHLVLEPDPVPQLTRAR